MPIPWGEIVTAVGNVVGSIFSNNSKNKAVKKQAQDDFKRQSEAMQQKINSDLLANGYKEIDGLIKVPWNFQNDEHKTLSVKAKDSRFGGSSLNASEKSSLDAYTALSMKDYNAISAKGNAISVSMSTNPVTNPVQGGFASGIGSSQNPLSIDEVSISDKVKKAGMSPLLLIGLLSVGGYALYQSNNSSGRKRRR